MQSIAVILLMGLVATTANAHDYKEGQLWSYRSRPGVESSVVLIILIEQHAKIGSIYHISVLQAHLPNLKNGSRLTMDLPHFPVSKETLDKSVVSLLGHREILAAYRNGYNIWRAAFDAGRAGVFTLSVAEIVATIEDTIK